MFDYVTSDLHLGHAAVIGYSKRPFASVEEMDEELVLRHNLMVRSEADTVLYVGDVAFGPRERCVELLSRMRGRKVLVIGNHDRSASKMAELGFDWVVPSLTFELMGRKVRVSHLPYPGVASVEDERASVEERGLEPVGGDGSTLLDPRYGLPRWQRVGRSQFLLHGHTHSKKRRQGQAIHVGVDAWDLRPATVTEIVDLMAEAERT